MMLHTELHQCFVFITQEQIRWERIYRFLVCRGANADQFAFIRCKGMKAIKKDQAVLFRRFVQETHQHGPIRQNLLSQIQKTDPKRFC